MYPDSWHELQRQYDHLTLHIVSGPRSLSYFIPFVLLPSVLLIPPSIVSLQTLRWIVLPLLLAAQIHVWARSQSFDVISINNTLMAFMLLGWYDVRQDFKHVCRRKQINSAHAGDSTNVNAVDKAMGTQPRRASEYDLESYPQSLWLRLRWVGTLCVSLRLTDWHIGRHSHDSRQPTSIQPFNSYFLNMLAHASFSYVLLDFASPTLAANICFMNMRIIKPSIMLLFHLYASLTMLTSHVPTLIGLLCLSPLPSLQSNQYLSPLTWPSHLGSVSSIYRYPETVHESFGLRAFWGTFWHQNMRYVTSTPGLALAALLYVPIGSLRRYMLLVSSSFFWSGIVHMGVIPPYPIDTSWTATQLRLRIAAFFWLQIIGVGFEVLLQRTLFLARNGKQEILRQKNANGVGGGKGEDKDRAISALKRLSWGLLAVSWTVSFLAISAWWTIQPVGCALRWWNLPLIPYSLVCLH